MLALGPLASAALVIRRRLLAYPARVSYDHALWPGWWPEDTALRAVRHLRDDGGVHDDAVDAALLLVGCAFRDDTTDCEITNLGGEVAMAVKVIQGRPSDYPESYWRGLDREAFAEHRLARAALHIALLDDATHWSVGSRRRRRVHGDAVHRVLPMLRRMRHPAAKRIAREVMLRAALLRPPIVIE